MTQNDINAPGEDGHTPLHWACGQGHIALARLLLEHGADVNVREGRNNRTGLHLACLEGHTDTARLLLEHRAEVNARDRVGCAPLHLACMGGGHPDIVRLLLEHGADITTRDGRDHTPLHLAMKLPPDNPAREELLDLFREYAPELVMEAYCSPGPGGGR
ncbi:MAG: ankyrin repeat domain-containing protein [Syntrophorhabdus sp.]|nr:ankyrin repeat domain-containing protein [Syntrophorhabdus sp.]